MPQLLSRPRTLPWDVLLLVFKESDPSTLAVLGRVSLDFLTSTSPILYRHVETRSVENLEMLFCERKKEWRDGKTKSRINHLLSISQIRTLSLYCSPDDAIEDTFNASFDRVEGWIPLLPLRSLTLTFQHPSHLEHYFRYLRDGLFWCLEPVQVEYRCLTRPLHKSPWWHLDAERAVREWSDVVQVLSFEGLLFTCDDYDPDDSLPDGDPYHNQGERSSLGGLVVRPSQAQRPVLQLKMSTLFCTQKGHAGHNPKSFVQAFEEVDSVLHLVVKDFTSIVLVVKSEEQRKEAEAAVQELKEEKLKSMFSVELEV